jgi:hypothetical protein
LLLETRLEELRTQADALAALTRLPDLVTPDYAASCIGNVPWGVAKLFGAPADRDLPLPLDPEGTPRRVALVVLDAFGFNLFLRAAPQVAALGRLVERGRTSVLTSVFPSTTNVALTSLYTGLTPVQHGMMGLLMFLREFGFTAHMLQFRLVGDRGTETLRGRGVESRALFPLPTLFERLANAGIESAVITRFSIAGTSLAQIHHHGASEIHTYTAASDLCVTLGRLLASEHAPRFIFAYWDLIDTISHHYGPTSDEAVAEVASFFASLEREVLDRLPPHAARDTLLVVTADHGHISLSGDSGTAMEAHPEIAACLRLPPTGASRYPFLHVLPGRMEALRAAFAALDERFDLMETEDALAAGLFGLGEPHPEARWRLGDAVAIARDHANLFRADTPREVRRLRGTHGGLSASEMLVPLLSARCAELIGSG